MLRIWRLPRRQPGEGKWLTAEVATTGAEKIAGQGEQLELGLGESSEAASVSQAGIETSGGSAAEGGLNSSLQLGTGASRSTVLAANRTLYDQFIESGGTLTRARSTTVFDEQGNQVFGRFFPESNEIMLYKGSNLGTLSEELVHFRDIQNSGLLYQEFNPNALLASPYGGTWTLRDSLEAHAQTVLYQWGYVGKP